MQVVRLVAAAFAVYRLSTLVALDMGPFDVFANWRVAAGRRAASGNRVWRSVAGLLNCPYCLGVWLAAAHLPLIFYPTGAGDVWLSLWAVAGLQGVLLDRANLER